MSEHGNTSRAKNSGKGGHSVLGHDDVADEAARATLAAASTVLDLMRVVRQTGGVWPGNYADDGAGFWAALTQSDDVVLDPAQIVGDQLAYNPTGWIKNPTKVRFDLDANRFIRGFEPTPGARWFVNTSAAFTATITHLDAAEMAGKKVFVPGGSDLEVPPGAAAFLWYDNTAGATGQVWRVLLASASPGEVNTASNSGAGAGLVQTKSGVDLPFKSLVGGTGATLTPGADEVTVSVDYGTGAGTAAQGNDARIPSQTENNALVGTSGVPGSGNKFVTDGDARIPSQTENDALVGTSGTPSTSNKFVTDSDARIPSQTKGDTTTSGDATAVIGSYDTGPDDTASILRVRTLGIEDSNANVQHYEHRVVIKKNGAAITIEQVDVISMFEGAGIPSADGVTFVVNSNAIDAAVRGIVALDLHWTFELESMTKTLPGG